MPARFQLKQVLTNLITNAIEAIDLAGARTGRLTVRTRVFGETVVVEVQDSGPGIDPRHAELIFDTFFTTKAKGTGLGLSICRLIIEDYGGRLVALPVAPHGAVFRFSLPVAKAS